MGSLTKSLGLEKGLKVSSVTKLWPNVVGPRFEKTSKIYSIYETKGVDNVLVAVSSSVVGQELSFYKKDILKKLHKIGQYYGFNIKEISFSTKYWKTENKQEEKEDNPSIEIELEHIEIPDKLLASVKESLEGKEFFSEEIKERMLNTIIKDLKTQIWMKKHNFPVCKQCKIPITPGSAEDKKLCPACKYNNSI